jgi:HAD superfamily hydrolase (TIGR01509 family)
VTSQPLRLVIFDCDGVLIDSEPLSRRIIAAEAAAFGWPLSETDAHAYTGMAWSALVPVFERATGRLMAPDWPAIVQAKCVAAMQAGGVDAVPGAAEALDAVRALGLKLRVASNSSHEEMAVKFAATGLAPRLAGLLHSARDVACGKPAPDLFLAAAAAEGVPPGACLVVEDSRPGILAAHAAGMACVAYAPDGLPADLAAMASAIRSLSELPPILRAAMLTRAA